MRWASLAVIHAIEDRYSPAAVAGLFPAQPKDRAEMWRLCEWVLIKLNDEVTRYVIEEKILKRDRPGATPDPGVLRVAKANLVEHLLYFNWLFATRQWIAGRGDDAGRFRARGASELPRLSGRRRPGRPRPKLRHWYARIKSRPAFRTLLNDRVGGMPPHAGYADLDF